MLFYGIDNQGYPHFAPDLQSIFNTNYSFNTLWKITDEVLEGEIIATLGNTYINFPSGLSAHTIIPYDQCVWEQDLSELATLYGELLHYQYAQTQSGLDYSGLISDLNVQIQQAVVAMHNLIKTPNDIVVVSDTPHIIPTFNKKINFTDGFIVKDLLVSIWAANLLGDKTVLSDNVRTASKYFRNFVDNLVVVENIAPQTTYDRLRRDGLVLADVLASAPGKVVKMRDAIILKDILRKVSAYNNDLKEVIYLKDNMEKLYHHRIEVAENISVGDYTPKNIYRLTNDNIVIESNGAPKSSYEVDVADTVNVGENISSSTNVSVIDGVKISSGVKTTYTHVLMLADGLVLSKHLKVKEEEEEDH